MGGGAMTQLTIFGDWRRVSILGADYPRKAHTVRADDPRRTVCGVHTDRPLEDAKATEDECGTCKRLRELPTSRGQWVEGV